ncbi:MAG: DUF5667 domain-containing protein [Candidatus Firestonebacteria bacterium]|mgnify:CR=1 FL=1
MNKIEDILDLCLEDLKNGKDLQEILAKYPDHAKELEFLLTIATKIQSIPKPEPSTNAAYKTMVEAGKYLSKEIILKPRVGLKWFINPRFAFAKVIVTILIVILFTWTTVNVSVSALPGDFLYPIKLATEKIKLILTVNLEGKAEMRLTFSEERMKELLSRYSKNGVIDNRLIIAMLDEAKLALNKISSLPKEKQPLFYSKVDHFNAYQKETLQSIQPHVSGQQKEYINNAIEICSNRTEWMQNMMKQGMYCPWDESPNCNWK